MKPDLRPVPHFRFRGRLEIAKERHRAMEYTDISLRHVVCLSMFLALCSKLLQSTDLGIQKKNPVLVFGCLSAPGLRGRCAVSLVHICHLKQTLNKRYVETEVVHMYRHDENTEARSQTRALTTLRLSTYSHSHYSDKPNKEMHSFTLHYRMLHIPAVTYTRTNQTDT